jgi:hypothetical protein
MPSSGRAALTSTPVDLLREKDIEEIATMTRDTEHKSLDRRPLSFGVDGCPLAAKVSPGRRFKVGFDCLGGKMAFSTRCPRVFEGHPPYYRNMSSFCFC